MAKITLENGYVIEGTVEELAQMAKVFSAPPTIEVPAVEIDGVTYAKVDRAPKVGDYVKISETMGTRAFDVTFGKYYEVTAVDEDGDAEIIDDVDDEYCLSGDTFEVFERVNSPLQVGDYVKIISDKTVDGEQRNVKLGEIRIIKEIDDDRFPYYAEKLDGSSYDYFRKDAIVRATDEEIAEATMPKVEPLKVGDYAKIIHNECGHKFAIGEIVRITLANKDGVDAAEHLDGSDSWFICNEEVVRATDAEVAEAKAKLAEQSELARWTAIGRKVNEFKVGDIVRVNRNSTGHVIGTIGEVVDENNGGERPFVKAVYKDGRTIDLYSYVELITPVEARFDRHA
jgi:hypothetical protein